jgi:hypothetical protein
MINVNEFKKQLSLIIHGEYQTKNHLQFNDVYMRFLTERFTDKLSIRTVILHIHPWIQCLPYSNVFLRHILIK